MAKVWVLDTETKGTGANMVPLEKVLTKPSPVADPLFVPHKPEQRPESVSEPGARRPPTFRVVDVMTRQTRVDGASTRETVDALKSARSIVDVDLYVWQPETENWRRLTLGEKRAVWEFRDM